MIAGRVRDSGGLFGQGVDAPAVKLGRSQRGFSRICAREQQLSWGPLQNVVVFATRLSLGLMLSMEDGRSQLSPPTHPGRQGCLGARAKPLCFTSTIANFRSAIN